MNNLAGKVIDPRTYAIRRRAKAVKRSLNNVIDNINVHFHANSKSYFYLFVFAAFVTLVALKIEDGGGRGFVNRKLPARS
jgi:hypothetical protein